MILPYEFYNTKSSYSDDWNAIMPVVSKCITNPMLNTSIFRLYIPVLITSGAANPGVPHF